MTKKGKKVTTQKKRKNSRVKGAGFERKIASMLSDWWGVEFHRTPSSGGLHWKQDNRVHGDIVAPVDATDYPFCNECKKVEGWDFEQLIKGTGEVTDWWLQCITDAREVKKVPLLTFSKNYSPIYYMIYQKDWEKLPLPNRNYFVTTFETEDENGKVEEHHVAVGMFDDLVSIPKDKVVKSLSK